MLFCLLVFEFLGVCCAWGVEPAPRLTDREIIEKLTLLEEGQRRLEERIEQEVARLEQKIESVRAELKAELRATNKRIEDTNRRIDDTNRRIKDINRRIEDIKWMLGIFISASLVMMGFVIRMLWLLQRRVSSLEAEQEKQRREINSPLIS